MRNSVVTTEMCSKYHPDKACDQVSDAILTECLRLDPTSKVACETLWKGETVVLAGEITTSAEIDYEKIVREVADSLNYKVSEIKNLITTQSSEIHNAVVKEDNEVGAGDQGIMWGYACNDASTDYLPIGLWTANRVIEAIEEKVGEGVLLGDAKTQIVAKGEDITEILVSVCHSPNFALDYVKDYIKTLLVEKGIIDENFKGLIVNPSGSWTFGGPAADCGLTGRKIVCDAYGGYAPVGGGALSGKDPSKVDRSGAYMARKIAVDMVNEFGLIDCSVQLSYGIGLTEPRSVRVIGRKRGIFGRVKEIDISNEVKKRYDLTPKGIIDALGLLTLDYTKIAGGNHMKCFS